MEEKDVSAALICREGRFLICQRPRHKKRGLLWEFVGGKVEPGETGEQALVRECLEELGIAVAVGQAWASLVHEYPDLTVRLTLYETRILYGEPKLYEHEALRWITPAQIGDYDFCPADETILARIKEKGLG